MITTLINQGLALQKQGNLDLALLHFQEAIKINSQDVATLVLLGNLSKELNQHKQSLSYFERALELVPQDAGIHYNKANALKALERYEEAIASYNKAIELKSDYADAYFNLSNTYAQLEQANKALEFIEKALKLSPENIPIHFARCQLLEYLQRRKDAIEGYDALLKVDQLQPEAYYARGNLQMVLEYYQDALNSFDRAIELMPDHAYAYLNRGNVLQEMNRLEEAVRSYECAISIGGDFADAYCNRGYVLQRLSRPKEALNDYNKAIAIKPNHIHAYSNRGNIYMELGLYDEAVKSYESAIEVAAEFADAHSNRGVALHELGFMDEALNSYAAAIKINPRHADAHFNLANALTTLQRYKEAVQSYDRAIESKPGFANAHTNKGVALQCLVSLAQARTAYSKAIALDSEHADALWNLALCNLLDGLLLEGWQGFEWRWKSSKLKLSPWQDSFTSPLWLGKESLQGKTILLHAEQGLGDTIQFARYAPMVAGLGATVTLLVPTALKRLLSQLEDVSEVIDFLDNTKTFDYQCPLMSLPLAFSTDLDTIPPPPKSLVISSEKAKYFEQVLGLKTKPRIGICWSSVSNHLGGHKRSLSLEQFLTGLPKEGYDYICLQKEIKPADQDLFKANPQIQWFGEQLNDFSDTAALIENLDLLVSVDTSVAHLAGSLNIPTIILLPFSPDWRWLLNRSDSPWYPSVTLLRQASLGDWGGVLKELPNAIGNLGHQCFAIDIV